MERPIPPLKMPENTGPYSYGYTVDGMLTTILFVPVMVLFDQLGEPLRLHFCPPATFLSQTLQPDWQMFSYAAAFFLTLFLRYWFLTFMPLMQETVGFDPPADGPWKHIWSHIWLAGFLLTAAPALAAQMSPMCAASDQITLRETPWAKVQRYRWNQVASVQSGCSNAPKGGWDIYYGLVMADGKAIYLTGSVPDFELLYPPVMKAFAAAGHHPPLNSQDIQPDCSYRNIGWLTHQP